MAAEVFSVFAACFLRHSASLRVARRFCFFRVGGSWGVAMARIPITNVSHGATGAGGCEPPQADPSCKASRFETQNDAAIEIPSVLRITASEIRAGTL